MRISDWSSDVCSSDLAEMAPSSRARSFGRRSAKAAMRRESAVTRVALAARRGGDNEARSEEHTSELQSLMRISYAVFCLKKKNNTKHDKQLESHINRYK